MKILSSLVFLLAMTAPSFAAPQGDKTEPPAQYVLTINGKPLPITLDREVSAPVAGGAARFKLSRGALRGFDKSGVRFSYPVGFSFEADTSEPGVVIWSMSGGDTTLMLQKFSKLPLAVLEKSFVGVMIQQYGRKNVVSSPTSVVLGGRKIAGQRLDISLAQKKLVQEIFTFSTAKNSFILIVQDAPDAGKPSALTTQLKALLAQNFRF